MEFRRYQMLNRFGDGYVLWKSPTLSKKCPVKRQSCGKYQVKINHNSQFWVKIEDLLANLWIPERLGANVFSMVDT